MGIETTSTLTNSVRTRYAAKYQVAAEGQRVYDQLASPLNADISQEDINRGTAITIPFISRLAPSEQVISQTADITPVTLQDATVTITPTSRGNAIAWSEELDIRNYTNYGARRHEIIGENMMESVDLMAQAKAMACPLVVRTVARASLDAGETTHRLTDAAFSKADAVFQTLNIPRFVMPDGQKRGAAIMHPYAYHDVRMGGNVVSVGLYQAKEIILNQELGMLGSFKLVVTPKSKVFWGAGIDNTTAIATTLAAEAKPLDTTITLTSDTSVAQGMRLNIGTEETGDTHYATNESVIVASVNTTTHVATIVGGGENGGLMYAHAAGVAVNNNDSVFPVIFGGPESLAMVWASSVGRYGEIVGPQESGVLKQFRTLGWKWWGGYDRVTDSRILRYEVASSLEA